MHTSDIQFPAPTGFRRRHSDEFKRQLISACQQPGASTAAVALANGLNANMLRRWISNSRSTSKPAAVGQTKAMTVATQAQFIPLQVQANAAAEPNIHIELQRGAMLVRVQWPVTCAADCAAWVRGVLK